MIRQETFPEANSELKQKPYAYLRLADEATLPEVVNAINGLESIRHSFPTEPKDEVDLLYEASLVRGIKGELARCVQVSSTSSDEELVGAIQGFTNSLRIVQQLPLGEKSMKRLDEAFFDLALDVLADEKSSPIEKAAGVTLSFYFGIAQRGADKAQMILEQRLAAEQAATTRHINPNSEESNQRRLKALEEYFRFVDSKYQTEIIDSTITAGAQRAAQITKHQLMKSRQALNDGARIGRRAAGITVIASMGVVGSSTLAAAENTPTTTQSETVVNTEAAVVQAVPAQVSEQAKSVPMTATVEAVVSPANVSSMIEAPEAATVAMSASVEAIDVSTIQVAPVSLDSAPAAVSRVVVKASVEALATDTTEETTQTPVLAPSAKKESATRVKVLATIDDEPLQQPTSDAPAPQTAVVIAPNNDVNVAVGETPKEAIARIVASRDMAAASYALRTMYGGINVSEQPPVNPVLTTLITSDIVTLRSQISEVAHGDPAYTDKAFYALAYLDAVTQSPALLDNPEVAAFIASIAEQDEYRNKLFATYLAEAHTALADEKAGAYNGIAEQYQAPIEKLYAFVAMAAMSDQKQAEQIEAIRAEEIRVAEEARKAAEEAERQRLESASGVIIPEAPTAEGISARAFNIIIEMGGDWTNRGTAMKYFVEHGFTPEQAAGIVGNLMVESGVDPAKKQYGNGPGRGLAQWGSTNPKYDRFGYNGTRGLVLFANEQGKPWEDLTLQLDFIMYELNGGESRAMAALKAAQTPEEAAFAFEDKYERAGIPHMDKRYAAANEMFAQYQQVRTAAEAELNTAYDTQKKAAEAEIARRATEAAAAKAAEEAAAAQAAAQAAAEAEAQRQAETRSEDDIRSQLADGIAVRAELGAKYNEVSGHLSDSELATRRALNQDGIPMTIHLHPDAAVGFDALSAAFEAAFGEPIKITDSYRDYDGQVRTKKVKKEKAATPGTSNHGWGMAIDFASDIDLAGSPQHKWMEENAFKYGYDNPHWAHDGKKKGGAEEPWHWEFNGSKASYEESNK